MSWLVALVGLTLSAPPEQAVVLVGRRTAVSAPAAKVLAVDASNILESAGVPIALPADKALQQLTRVSVKDTSSCNGKRACLAELGRQLKVPWVVLLSVAAIDQEQARIRQNMAQLEKDNDLYRRYVKKLNEQEDEVEALRTRIEELTVEEAKQRAALDEYLLALEVE